MIAIMAVPMLAAVNARAAPSGSGKIMFIKRAERFADDQIHVMNEDGSNETLIWGKPHVSGEGFVSIIGPAVSPDGRKIAFSTGQGHIYVINADGSGLTQLTAGEESEEGPAFSPDGSKIAFSCHLGALDQICVMNADGSNVTRLTDPPSAHGNPVFSPDGSRIIFNSTRDGRRITVQGVTGLIGNQIYMMNVDGSKVTRLTNFPLTNYPAAPQPILGAFSPDGRRIAFFSVGITYPSPTARPSITGQIHVMNADGSNVRRLTNNAGSSARPTFSPDGRKIAFTYAPPTSDEDQIFLMDADGSNMIQLTNPPGISSWPVFIP